MALLITIDAADPRPIYVQITDEVRRSIVVGTLKADDPLPSVRQLAGQLRVNPNTVQQAYRELERVGLIYVRRGQGTFISASASDGKLDDERRAFAWELARRALHDAYRHGLTVDDLMKAIREIEKEGDPK
jgi:GntR family transcriptional regulator